MEDDHIMKELRQIREEMLEECGGDVRLLSERARKSALADGFVISDRKPRLKELKRQSTSA